MGVGCQDEVTGGADYIGTANTTSGGLTCQAWSVQEPHEHGLSDVGDHNYCRNPDGHTGGVWCYTTDPDIKWEECHVPLCGTGNLGFFICILSKQAVLPPPPYPPPVSSAPPLVFSVNMGRSCAAVPPSPSPAPPPPQEAASGKSTHPVLTQPVVLGVRSNQQTVPTTVGQLIQPQEASPVRRGRSRKPMNMTTPTMAIITTAGTLMLIMMLFGASLRTLTYHGTTALCPSVLNRL